MPSTSRINRPARLRTIAAGEITYSGRRGSSRATSRRGALGARWASRLVSSGRQIPTSEQRGHFGLSISGVGGMGRAALARISATSLVTHASASGGISTW